MSAIVLIPARMASTRLPGKPMAEIGGEAMIVQVWRRAKEADVGPVAVAAAEEEILDAVRAVGGEAVLTDPDLPSGSDRINQALQRLDPDGRHDVVVNVQGDLPTLDPGTLRAAVSVLQSSGGDIATLVAEIRDAHERDDPSVVKAIVAWEGAGQFGEQTGWALYFTRATAPAGEGPLWHHIGLYAYRRAALERFVTLPVSRLEQREKLEQLRALEAGMTIAVARVDSIPLGVDTPADLERARALLAPMP
ncbi:MAG: 3-deoxy-manno-octulosonate cytidylyltransferase [Alphaproteobacteria bacterium]|jgi:3-deoxy-manno-octulosonate cytidylyltransferase (CMP-KDO synthetase)|nr:3-deoxy-manno-octulosonate cytidylyltransferase [Rhodospirillaceae bacterium]MBT6202456.1 3-deoxy-manno-octulosonate cytidylyltransferase [Rhodospirillaceae bacterium]MBT6512255.1 3-deoxy-manno-octulosonate cytidylyltransferase [Rhodospirillaceae bacterium]MBT7645945.1 3-deoxy-manno-octulosonate cytidylyltransferase [Rhodospirillaceae bacterium]MDG2481171.1 3-deoxy-manno-octulosonate cytidylyltransferase [Alphaproteobacteria bacterium]